MPNRPTPQQYQPPLRWYSHAWRLAVCLVLSAILWSQSLPGQLDHHHSLFWIDLLVGIAAFALVGLRRQHPLAIALVTAAMTTVSALAAGPATLAAVSLATRRRLGQMVLVAVTGIVCGQGYADTQPFPEHGFTWSGFAVNIAINLTLVGWGAYIGSQRELMWTLRERAEQAESEAELRAVGARSTERARIAREMHDVLAHRISQVSMHAGALAFRRDLSAEEMRGSAEVIQGQANEALHELRSVLGVLRSPETGEPVSTPQPTLADLPELIARAREAGMNIDFTDDVDATEPPPSGVGRTVYRIVQEGLTNAHKHVPGAKVRIRVSGSPAEGLTVTLRNPLGFSATAGVPGAGLGLLGLAERAQLRGGRLSHKREADEFELTGWIPWTP